MFKMHVGSVDATVLAIRNVAISERVAARAAINAAGKIFKTAVVENASRRDHSLYRLSRMDHPFAKRHGRIQAGRMGGAWVQKPYMVHERSGRFKKAIFGKPSTSPKGGVAYTVGVPSNNRHAVRIIQGTPAGTMLPRNLIWLTGKQKNVQKKMKVAIIKTLGAKLRTQAAIRFA